MSEIIAVRTFGSRSGSIWQRMCSKFMELTVRVGSFYARSCVGGRCWIFRRASRLCRGDGSLWRSLLLGR